MEESSMSQRSEKNKTQTHITRRSWTTKEEEALVSALKEIVSRGWKCENGFKTGYLAVLEQHMAQTFPGTDIKSDPHIISKIHVWKKQYGTLYTMLSRSGFGWNDAACTIDVIDDHVWDEYVKSDKNARTMRHKSWPFYKDWGIIFGKDRATGQNAAAFVDAVNELVQQDKGNISTSAGADFVPSLSANMNDDDSESMSTFHDEVSTSPKGKKKASKRPRTQSQDDVDGRLVDMLSKFFDNTETRLGELVRRIGFEHDASSSRKKVFDALSSIEYLTVEDKLNVTKAICSDTKHLDIFFSIADEHKAVMVSMILDGRF